MLTRNFLHCRFYSTPITLAFDAVTVNKSGIPLVILHGLFGSKQNWRSLSKQLGKILQCPIYTIDLRNHGDSPHSPEHGYEHMTQDLKHFAETHQIDKFNLLGHSMGGKAAMHFTLNNQIMVNKLCVVDIAPVNQPFKASSAFHSYIKAMKEIPLSSIKNQGEADVVLQKTIPELAIRQFLLTNLKKTLAGYEFRINLNALSDVLADLWSFPASGSSQVETLFIKGSKSNYIDIPRHSDMIKEYFPNSRIETIIGAGHWVHSENPGEFVNLLTSFLAKG